MAGDNAEVGVDPSKNPEVLFTQRKKAPGMQTCCILTYLHSVHVVFLLQF